MTTSLGDEICLYLQGLGVGLNFNGVGTINLFTTLVPDQPPDYAVGVIERGGLLPLMTLTGGGEAESRFERPTVQIRVRSSMNGYVIGNSTTQVVFKALQGITERVLNPGGSLFHLIRAVQSPVYLGRDQRERHQWSQNFAVMWSNAQR